MTNGYGWRWSLGLAAVPAVCFIIGTLLLPDTPNSLLERGQKAEAKQVLKSIRGIDNVDEEYNDLVAAGIASKKIKSPWRNLTRRKYMPQLVFCTLIPFFQQLTGMNVFMFYAPVLFKTIGFGTNASLVYSLITGGVNCVSTLVSILSADKFGRRGLFIQGGIQMLICQIVITLCIGLKFGPTGDPGVLPNWYAAMVVTAICICVAGFAWSWGLLGWLVPTEILPLEVRSAGQSLNVCVNMLFTFLIAQIFTKLLCHFKFGLFIFFAIFVIIMTGFIYLYFPEIKGILIEEMAEIWKEHGTWRKYVMDYEEEDKEKIDVQMSDEKTTIMIKKEHIH